MRKARQRHFYPRPPRGGRRSSGESILPLEEISIHALREEGDPTPKRSAGKSTRFLSTPSARRATAAAIAGELSISRFLSTPSARRATAASLSSFSTSIHFYPRPPRGGRPASPSARMTLREISIHALREEGDPAAWPPIISRRAFLSTPSARRATHPLFASQSFLDISIHALREEGDLFM